MRIGVLSDCRVPTAPQGEHGLGRFAIDLARGLRALGYAVTLYAGPGSGWDGELRTHANETLRAHQLDAGECDVWVDVSHYHDLSRVHPTAPIVNWIADLECPYAPPRAVVGSGWQQRQFPEARIVPLGIDVDSIPLSAGARSYLTYCAKITAHKGYDIALKVAARLAIPTYFVGMPFVPDPIPNWRGVIHDDGELHAWLGGAVGLLSPCRHDAGGRINLEAAACGTPTLCLDGTGTMCHVEHGVSGFICADADEMVDAVQDLPLLDARQMRQWVVETHSRDLMARSVAALCRAAADGEAW